MKWFVLLILLIPLVDAKVFSAYPLISNSEYNNPRDRISFPHIYPGQTFTSEKHFLGEPMRPGTSAVRWTSVGAYSIVLDKIHLERKDYVLIIKSKKGPQIRMLPFETTKVYLEPEYFKIRFDKETSTVWLAKYSR
jgi:hypothetical protein